MVGFGLVPTVKIPTLYIHIPVQLSVKIVRLTSLAYWNIKMMKRVGAMTREEAKHINYLVGSMLLEFHRHKPHYAINNYDTNDGELYKELEHLRSEIADFVLSHIFEG
jgi:hypothetical protein